jgi:hypothetical protein
MPNRTTKECLNLLPSRQLVPFGPDETGIFYEPTRIGSNKSHVFSNCGFHTALFSHRNSRKALLGFNLHDKAIRSTAPPDPLRDRADVEIWLPSLQMFHDFVDVTAADRNVSCVAGLSSMVTGLPEW